MNKLTDGEIKEKFRHILNMFISILKVAKAQEDLDNIVDERISRHNKHLLILSLWLLIITIYLILI